MSVGNIIFCVLSGVLVIGVWLYLVWWEEIVDTLSEAIGASLIGLVIIGVGETYLYSFLKSSEIFSIGDALYGLFGSVMFTILTVSFIGFFIYFGTVVPCHILTGKSGFNTAGKVCGLLIPLIVFVLFSSWLRSFEPTEPNFLHNIFKWLDIIQVVIWIIGSIIIRIYNTVEQNKINNRKKRNELHDEKVAIYNSIKQSEKELDALKDKLNKSLIVSNMVMLLDCCGEVSYDINKKLKPYYDELDNIKSAIQNKEDEVNNLKAEHERKNKL